MNLELRLYTCSDRHRRRGRRGGGRGRGKRMKRMRMKRNKRRYRRRRKMRMRGKRIRKDRGNMEKNFLDTGLVPFRQSLHCFLASPHYRQKIHCCIQCCSHPQHPLPYHHLDPHLPDCCFLAAIIILSLWLFIDHVIFSSIQIVRDSAIFERSGANITTIWAHWSYSSSKPAQHLPCESDRRFPHFVRARESRLYSCSSNQTLQDPTSNFSIAPLMHLSRGCKTELRPKKHNEKEFHMHCKSFKSVTKLEHPGITTTSTLSSLKSW